MKSCTRETATRLPRALLSSTSPKLLCRRCASEALNFTSLNTSSLKQRKGWCGIFKGCPWGYEGKKDSYCYECHEELLHNPVLLPEDIAAFARLVRFRGLNEKHKIEDRSKLAGRIMLLHECISLGLTELLKTTDFVKPNPS